MPEEHYIYTTGASEIVAVCSHPIKPAQLDWAALHDSVAYPPIR